MARMGLCLNEMTDNTEGMANLPLALDFFMPCFFKGMAFAKLKSFF